MTAFRRRRRQPASRGDYDGDGYSLPEALRAAPWDGTTVPLAALRGEPRYTSAPAAPLPAGVVPVAIKETGRDTEPLARLRARGPQPATFPALPPAPAPQPPPWAGRDCAIPVLTRDGHGILCSHCRWRRHADPEALTFRELRRSAWLAGWRKDLFGNWNCTRCKMNPGFWTPQPPAHWDPATEHGRAPGDWPARHWLQRRRPATEDHADASAAWVARDPAAEFWFTVEAEHEVLRRTADGASHGRHHRTVTS